MPPRRSRIAALVAAGALAAPASAVAQSAGDEQYQDPFAGEDQGQSQGGGDGGGAQQPTAPAPSAPAPEAAPAPAPSAPAPAPAASQSQLPYTGAETGAIMLAGTILLAGGIALRVRLRERS